MSTAQKLGAITLAKEESYSDEEILARVLESPAERPESDERDEVAAWLALQHFGVSPSVTDIYYLPTDAPADEIRLLEVSRLMRNSEEVPEALDYRMDIKGLNYRLIVAHVSPEEHQRLRTKGLPLPDGWVLDQAWHWIRQ